MAFLYRNNISLFTVVLIFGFVRIATCCKVTSSNILPKTECFDYDGIINSIRKKTSIKPKILIICGSGLEYLGNIVQNPVRINYTDILHFPKDVVQGQKGVMIFGKISGQNVMLLQGRFHYYQGFTMQQVTLGVRVAYLLGAKKLIVTNAAGGINKQYKVGNIMILKDQINFPGFSGNNPLRGPNNDKFGPRFPPMQKLFEKDLRKKALEIAKRMNIQNIVHEGVYAMVGGPSYETVAEVRLLRQLGADAVGFSTVPEVIEAKHSNMTIFALSIISNVSIYDYDEDSETNQDEVVKAVSQVRDKVQTLITKIIAPTKK